MPVHDLLSINQLYHFHVDRSTAGRALSKLLSRFLYKGAYVAIILVFV